MGIRKQTYALNEEKGVHHLNYFETVRKLKPLFSELTIGAKTSSVYLKQLTNGRGIQTSRGRDHHVNNQQRQKKLSPARKDTLVVRTRNSFGQSAQKIAKLSSIIICSIQSGKICCNSVFECAQDRIKDDLVPKQFTQSHTVFQDLSLSLSA